MRIADVAVVWWIGVNDAAIWLGWAADIPGKTAPEGIRASSLRIGWYGSLGWLRADFS